MASEVTNFRQRNKRLFRDKERISVSDADDGDIFPLQYVTRTLQKCQ